MAKRLHGDVYGINGTKYTIEIHDQVQSATSLECNFSADGIDYKGNGNPLYQNTIMSSSCEVNIKIDSQGKLNIIWDIISKGENWYYIVIKKSDSIYWIGTLIADQITIPRGSYQGVIQTSLKANDRLSILENLPFDFGTFSLDGARERGLEIIKQILQFDVSHFLDEWGASDRYLLDSIESKEATQADGVLLNTSYKKQSFIKDYNTRLYVTGEVEYISCAEAIKQILMPHKAQILLSDGTYIIRQVENNFSASTEFNAYTKTLSALTTYTISNGINVQDNARSCFAAQPDYTFQPAIREISSEITKQNSVDAIKTTFDDSNMVLNFPNGLSTNKNVRLSFKTGELVSAYGVGGVTNYAFETHFAALIYGTYAGEYYYYQNSVWNNNGTTIPDSTKSFIFFTVTRYNNAPEESLGNLEFLSHSAFLSDVVINIWARDHIYAPRVSYPSFDPKFRQAYWSFSQIVTADFTGSLSLQVSYNNADDDEEPEFEESKKYANDIKASNANFTNDVEYKNVYHSGDEDDIFGLMTYNGSTWVENPSIQQVGFTETHKFELLPLVMAANIYENTVYTLEGSLLTNGFIHAINSIEIDGDTWVFNGGRLLFMNESIDGQWVRIYKNNINSGNGGYLAHSGQDGILSDLRGLNIKVEKVGGQMGDLLGQLMVRVFEEQGETANPTEDTTKALKLAYTHSTGGYKYKFEEEAAGGGTPFNVTSDTSLVDFGATIDITLTGNYFKSDSVVTISKGTLNTTTINSSQQMVLNVTAIASSEAVNTCDVTIDGVTFTTLWTYALNYNGTLADDYISARGITNAEHEAALHTLEAALFAANLTDQNGDSTKIKSLYLYGGTQSTAAGHKWNFMDATDSDAAFRETYYGGLTHGSNGITGNGTDGYIDPHFAHSDFAGQNDCHVMTYIRDNQSPSGLQAAYGAIASSFNGTRMFPKYNGTTMLNALFGSTGGGVANTDSSGLWITTRTGTGNQPIYRNGSSFGLIGSSSSSAPTASIKGLCVDYNNSQIIYQYSSYNICARGYGNGLSSTESSAYSSALNTYFTTLGINTYT